MITAVNPYFLHRLLEPLTGLADDDDAVLRYSHVDRNDEHAVREIIRTVLVPHARLLAPEVMERVRLAYQYYLSKPDSNFDRVYYSNLLPFDAPDDPRKFFQWLWSEVFVDDDYHLAGYQQYAERPDLEEVNSL
jgi:hypothetical protein